MFIELILIAHLHYVLCTVVQICTPHHISSMHSKRFDNLSRSVVDLPFINEGNDCCDYEDNTKDYNWTSNDFITLNLNIRGLYSKISDLNDLINRVETNQNTPSAITISETWLNKHSPKFDIPGYKIYREDRQHKRGGGVAVLVNNRLSSRKVEIDIESSSIGVLCSRN